MTTTTRTPNAAIEEELRETLELAKPNGPVLAALLASGLGSAVLGVFTTVAQSHAGFRALMDIDKNLGFAVGVGPLSGKTIYAVAAWLLAWAVAGLVMRGRNYNARPFFIATFALIAGGFLLTFPLFFDLFAP